ncbi:MAG TPA: radical SAM protein [Candidatus Brocadiia bacterium]|nr:radical SAM protein [Candidatus Brocadiia bacterium]
MTGRIALVSSSAGREDARSHWPHYGLTLLATVLRRGGWDARVFDQSFLRWTDEAAVEAVRRFKPDIVGMTLYTTHAKRALRLADRIQEALPGCRMMAGGPHVSLYGEAAVEGRPWAALVKGEADGVAADVAEQVLRGEAPGVVTAGPTEGPDIPDADFTTAEGYERMQWLPIQLSRGCPFNCSFCEVRSIATRRIRYRDPAACLEEIARNLGTLEQAHTVRIVDDCPTLDRPRFKRFLADYASRGFPARISVDNMRADTIDEELVHLLKACRTPHICLGVESGNPEVFRLVDKGETLEDIEAAAAVIKRAGMPLQTCFVVGLPGSTFAAEMDSLRLAKRLKPEIAYWNMFLPHRGTRAREWFVEHGRIYEERDVFSLPDYNLDFTLPPTETPEFSREDRIRAWLKCVLETASFRTTPGVIAKAVVLACRYRLWSSVPVMMAAVPRKLAIYVKLLASRSLARQTRSRAGRKAASAA